MMWHAGVTEKYEVVAAMHNQIMMWQQQCTTRVCCGSSNAQSEYDVVAAKRNQSMLW